MKTLCFTLVLLLFTVYCSLELTQLGSCCFGFSTIKIPIKVIAKITKTHSSCPKKGYIVQTERGRKFCYREVFQWNLNPYSEASGQQG
uniref:Chemokine interleukin-8-like domain-containing protein n=1 Tax=Anabas testudineus TaxID=64144 RepID=A0A3Q1HRW5_ANATE